MDVQRDFWVRFSQQLILHQQKAVNLTSYEAYPFPGKLEEISYPVDYAGNVVAPEQLHAHSRSHMFPFPACFHGCDSRIVIAGANGAGGKKNAYLMCGSKLSGGRCDFHVDLNKILSGVGGAVRFAHYRFRQAGSADSSAGLPTPVSMSSMESLADSSRMSTDEDFASTHMIPTECSDFMRTSTVAYDSDEMDSDDMDSFIDDSSSVDDDGYSTNISGDSCTSDDGYSTDVSGDSCTSDDGSYTTESSGGDSCLSELILDDVVLTHGKGTSSASQSTQDSMHHEAVIKGVDGLTRGSRIIVHASRVTIRKTPRKSQAVLDADAYPLLARPDGLPAIASCLEPSSRDFNNELFLTQIMSDSHKRNIGY